MSQVVDRVEQRERLVAQDRFRGVPGNVAVGIPKRPLQARALVRDRSSAIVMTVLSLMPKAAPVTPTLAVAAPALCWTRQSRKTLGVPAKLELVSRCSRPGPSRRLEAFAVLENNA